MDELYIDVKTKTTGDGYCHMSVYSAITLFVFKFCHVDQHLTLHFVTRPSSAAFPVKLRCCEYSTLHWLHCEELPDLVQSCELPVIVCSNRKLIISGLCSATRYIVQTAQRDVQSLVDCGFADTVMNLLGLRQNCLRACAEVSEWTHYTEVTLPQLVERILNNSDIVGTSPPTELLQLENQLSKLPVEPSRRRSRKQQLLDTEIVRSCAVENVVKEERMSRDRIDKVEEVREGISFVSPVTGDSKSVAEKFDNLHVVDSAEEICGRRFVEGSNVQLTDLILFVCVELLFSSKGFEQCCSHLPRIMSWYQRMSAVPNISNTVNSAGFTDYHSVASNIAKGSSFLLSSSAANSDISLKPTEDDSHSSCTFQGCYAVSDLLHTRSKADDQNCIQHTEKTKFHASQGLIDTGIAKATEMGLLPAVLPVGYGSCLQLPWEQYPSWVLPCGLGGVPDKRATRKLHQLESIAAAVKERVSARSVGSESSVMVDFCSGGGHVGILLAYLFPHYKVILVENKAESVRRAVERIACSSANNITVVQCNLGRFHAPFDIGICLHACGVATDLVLAKCIVASASFVVSPCCYGSIRSGPSVKYPRSDIFQAAGLDYLEYLALGHAADQTQATIAKSGQGRVCMSIVDSDRCCLARQLGYTAQIFEMTPPTCSPKNHILTGWPSSSDGSI